MKALTKEAQDAITPMKAIELLKIGNERFVNNHRVRRDLLQQMNETSNGQYPFAVILSCIDSRTSAELIFDQGLGDIFSIRIAGNIINDDVLGSIEFSCKVAGAKIIVVLGHSQCGAVKGACDNVKMGNLTSLLNKITPAIKDEKTVQDNRTSTNHEFVEKVADINVKKNVHDVVEKSPIIKSMIESGTCGIIGSMHNISTGKVTFYEDSLLCGTSKEK